MAHHSKAGKIRIPLDSGIPAQLQFPVIARHLGPRQNYEFLIYVACGLLHIFGEVANSP